MQADKTPKTGPRRRWTIAASAAAALFFVLAQSGCEVKRGNFTWIDSGVNHLENDAPIQAVEQLEKSVQKEKATRSKARAYLAVAYERGLKTLPAFFEKSRTQRNEALEAVRSDPEAMRALLNILKQQRGLVAQAAENTLAALSPESVPGLINLFHDEAARFKAQRVLEQIGEPATPKLEEAIRSADYTTGEKAELIRLLGKVADENAVPFLKSLFENDAQPDALRAEAAAALYPLGDRSGRTYLLQSLDSSDLEARRAASFALSSFIRKPPASQLLARLSDEDSQVRLHIVKAIEKHGDSQTVPALIKTLQDEPVNRNEVANAIVEALAKFKNSAISPTLRALGSPRPGDHWVRRQRLARIIAHEETRRQFTDKQKETLYDLYLNEKQDEVKGLLADILTKFDEEERGGG